MRERDKAMKLTWNRPGEKSEPRPALAALLLAVAVGSFGVTGVSPSAAFLTFSTEFENACAAGLRYVNNLRVVYDVRAQLEELRGEPAAKAAPRGKAASSALVCPATGAKPPS
jgi:hypothetical protein